jgi:hypothetical protein
MNFFFNVVLLSFFCHQSGTQCTLSCDFNGLLMCAVRRVPPSFSIPPPSLEEVMLGASLNLTCVAVGSPMPFVKWRQGEATDLTPDDKLPVGRNVLELAEIRESANYTCIAVSPLGVIEATTLVRVQGEFCAAQLRSKENNRGLLL